jgi:transcriptional regulator with XRE-family HTH domain
VNERLKKLRKALDLTQQEFADRIGSKRNTVAKYETEVNTPSAAVVSLICREFNVSEEWLRNGTGEMFLPTDRNADIARLTKQLLDEESDSFKNRLISILANLSIEEWQYLEKRAKELCGLDKNVDKESH